MVKRIECTIVYTRRSDIAALSDDIIASQLLECLQQTLFRPGYLVAMHNKLRPSPL